MKKYSIGYVDNYNNFTKIWEKGYTKKFATLEEAEEFIKNCEYGYAKNEEYKIMQGWKTIKIVKK